MALSDQEIGERIKTARQACHLTQNQFAAKIHVSQQTLSRYENGINAVPNNTLEHIAKELDISLTYFMGVSSVEFSDEEILLIELYRKANDKIKRYIVELVKLLMMD